MQRFSASGGSVYGGKVHGSAFMVEKIFKEREEDDE